eukprot:TRINITY_DN5633_c0_g1_i2.p1 TRINITY_DN5633_c0_g1~~TRINITY_DN5633_c0_g1_i2.p1  ORF type:complete len:196 (-),score=10.33 TRINITY_DN5633_c0_g1_i2:57-644(-)
MNPLGYGLCDNNLDARTMSTLTLLARCLQKMANMMVFIKEREPHLHLVNDFLKSNAKRLALFISSIVDMETDETSNDKLSSEPSVSVHHDLAYLVSFYEKHIDYLLKNESDPLVVKLSQILKKIKTEVQRVDVKRRKIRTTSHTQLSLQSAVHSSEESLASSTGSKDSHSLSLSLSHGQSIHATPPRKMKIQKKM